MKFKTMTLLALLAANSFFLQGAMLHGADTPAEKAEFARYMEQAEKGDAGAMCNLGWCYNYGKGVEKNHEEAVKWYKKAAGKGDAWAMNNLGNCYKNGKGVEKNYKEAVKWFKKAAEKGNAWAMNNLGNCYKNGKGVEKNEAEAEKWYKKAFSLFLQEAKEGNDTAMCNLGWCYKNGNGVEKNYEEAVKWYKKAAEKGNDTAMCNLGICYENGEGVEKNYEEAVKWYKKAAEEGNADAMNYLGECYAHGNGVKKDYEKAFEWFTKAAEQGHIGAVRNLAYCYRDGDGVEEDDAKAFELFQQVLASDEATKKQKEDAHEEIAKAYLFGNGAEWSIPLAHWHFKEAGHPFWYLYTLWLIPVLLFMVAVIIWLKEDAADWLSDVIEGLKGKMKYLAAKRKAQAGDVNAMYDLGNCFRCGKGVKKNYAEAIKWYTLAAEKGNTEAMCDLGFIYNNDYNENDCHNETVSWSEAIFGDAYPSWAGIVFAIGAIIGAIIGGVSQLERFGGGIGETIFVMPFCSVIGLGIVWISMMLGAFFRGIVGSISRKKAAAAGDANAMAALGEYYAEKKGETNRAKAILWLQRAADAEHSGALSGLAKYYREGIGVEKDEAEAERLEKRSVAKHRKNQEEAVKWYKKAAELGDANAAICLGSCYEDGEGVEKNYEEAVKWYKKAVELDNTNANAATVLGLCCYIEKNYSEAIKWLEKAVELGNTDANAATVLRVCYDHSNQKDEAEAEKE